MGRFSQVFFIFSRHRRIALFVLSERRRRRDLISFQHRSYAAALCYYCCCHYCAVETANFSTFNIYAQNHPPCRREWRKKREPFATALSGAHFKAPKRLFNGCLHQIRKTITEYHIKFIAAHSSFASFSLYVRASRLGRLSSGLLFNFVTAIFFCYSVCLRSRILMFVDSRRRQCDLMDFVPRFTTVDGFQQSIIAVDSFHCFLFSVL